MKEVISYGMKQPTLTLRDAHDCIYCTGDDLSLKIKAYGPQHTLRLRVRCNDNECHALGPLADSEHVAVLKWNRAKEPF